MTTPDKDPTAPKHAKAGEPAAKKKKGPIIALSILLVALLCGIAVAGWTLYQQNAQLDKAAQEAKDAPQPSTPTGTDQEEVDNPIDFAELTAQNADIYAWIFIPNTNVNYPILQHATDDLYYLNNNRYHEWSFEGALFTQKANAKDFSDPVTVVYGHNNANMAMFATLHYFENEEFFNENKEFYIYTPDSILTYEVISAYEYDDRHILNSFHFNSSSVITSYFDSVLNPTSMLANVREGASLTSDDKIVQLSTCMNEASKANSRYIVTGVLVNEQPTK